ncbi:hypothetical protein B296_00059026, partial [Ensete ventricosum]
MKSGGGAGTRSTVPPTTDVSASTVATNSLAEKRPSIDEGLSPRKRNHRKTFKHLADTSGSSTVLLGKGKEPVAIEEDLGRRYTLRELWTICAGLYTSPLAKQVYECSSEKLMHKASKSVVWVSALSFISFVFFPSFCLSFSPFSLQSLRAANKELKGWGDQDLVAVVKFHAKELEGNVDKLQVELKSLENQQRRLEEEVG